MKKLCVMVFVLCAAPFAPAQLQVSTIHVRVLRARNGKPVRHAGTSTTLLPLQIYATPIPRTTDRAGTITLLVQNDAQVRVAITKYAVCSAVSRADRGKPLPAYPVERIVTDGVVAANHCSGRTVAPTPGELTLFVRSKHWWTRLHY